MGDFAAEKCEDRPFLHERKQECSLQMESRCDTLSAGIAGKKEDETMARTQWYRDMIVYQIWPRSFCDGNGDGIGDLYGVLQKLDYIKSLGADAIWFSPLYPSPNADYGYDISDYKNIHPDFGGLEAFQEVLERAHGMGMRVFMDLVVNHSSDEHFWFQESLKGHDNPYHDYYYWRHGTVAKGRRKAPNNWTSILEGGAWEYNEDLDKYYLHLFAKKQPDLNWSNPAVREEIKDIMRFWLDMGVDGFREDVITYIGKAHGLPNSYPALPVANGIKHYSNQPAARQYLAEIKRDVLDCYDCFTVGESPMTTPEIALQYISDGPDKVLDEMIAFSHMEADCFMTDMVRLPFDLRKMKRAFSAWQEKLQGKAWNALYIENHDHPRIISRYGSEKYRTESGKMLAAMYMLQRGTPFIYQGQEIGMTNITLQHVDQFKDVSTHNAARLLAFLPEKAKMKILNAGNRENSRTPMQWSPEENAGFTTGTPWFFVNENHKEVNVETEDKDPDSVLNFYRTLISFRKSHPVVLRGDYREHLKNDRFFFVYERNYLDKKLLVICAFTEKAVRFEAPAGIVLRKGRVVLSNYSHTYDVGNGFTSRPYELRVYLFDPELPKDPYEGLRKDR
jgi:oligo-1,6-glucosidase